MNMGIEITLVPKEQIYEDTHMIRISCDGFNNGWGATLGEAIKNFDEVNEYRYKMDSSKLFK